MPLRKPTEQFLKNRTNLIEVYVGGVKGMIWLCGPHARTLFCFLAPVCSLVMSQKHHILSMNKILAGCCFEEKRGRRSIKGHKASKEATGRGPSSIFGACDYIDF